MPILTVTDVPKAVAEHIRTLGMTELMNHGWITVIGDQNERCQLGIMDRDLTGPENPTVSIFVDDIREALARVQALGLEIVHPLTDEDWGVTRFFYRDSQGNVINVGTHQTK